LLDPPKSDRHFERFFEMEASMGRSPQRLAYSLFYMSRLLRATGRDEALVLLNHWMADLGDSTGPYPEMAALFAIYGDTRTALELKSRSAPAGVPYAQLSHELFESSLASALGEFDEADQHLVKAVAIVRDFAVPRMEATCLIAFAQVAVDRGDYAQACRLLATAESGFRSQDKPFRSPMEALVLAHCARVLREVLDPEVARTTQAEGAALSVKEALDAELGRTRTRPGANPFD
jgi:ATP/maltotriose-dependent transcriptional regulator MalT